MSMITKQQTSKDKKKQVPKLDSRLRNKPASNNPDIAPSQVEQDIPPGTPSKK